MEQSCWRIQLQQSYERTNMQWNRQQLLLIWMDDVVPNFFIFRLSSSWNTFNLFVHAAYAYIMHMPSRVPALHFTTRIVATRLIWFNRFSQTWIECHANYIDQWPKQNKTQNGREKSNDQCREKKKQQHICLSSVVKVYFRNSSPCERLIWWQLVFLIRMVVLAFSLHTMCVCVCAHESESNEKYLIIIFFVHSTVWCVRVIS